MAEVMNEIIIDDSEFYSHDEHKKCSLSEAKLKRHPEDIIKYIRLCYIAGALFWILILHLLKLYRADLYIILILAIPFLCFGVAFVNAPYITGELEDELFKSNYLSIGLVIVIPMLSWINNDYKGDKTSYTRILILAIITTLLSMVDIWVTDRIFPVLKHCQSILQTFSLTLLIYGLYSYYTEAPHAILK